MIVLMSVATKYKDFSYQLISKIFLLCNFSWEDMTVFIYGRKDNTPSQLLFSETSFRNWSEQFPDLSLY